MKRKDAVKLGLKKYNTGNPCKKGHTGDRYSSVGACIQCTNEYSAIWKSRNPEKSAKIKRDYYDREKANVINRAKSWYENHKSRTASNVKSWRARNPEKKRAYDLNRKSLGGKINPLDIYDLLSKQKNKCANCLININKKYHVDHIMPLSKGGSGNKENLQILCQKCNLTKHAKDPVKWARENGRLL